MASEEHLEATDYTEETDFTEPCKGSRCKICKQIVSGDTTEKYTCQSRNVIYLITSSVGGQYVGKTKQTLATRMSKHKHSINVGHGDGKKFIDHFRQYGFDKATITVLDSATNEQELKDKEKQWIKHYDSYENGLNSTRGG